MNDSAPPPHAPPQSWQNPGAVPHSTTSHPPAFDPRRAMGNPAAHSARHGTHPVMAPPPVPQNDLAHGAPSPYAAPSPYEAPVSYSGQAVAPQAAPPYPAQQSGMDTYRGMAAPHHGYAPEQYDQNYGGQPAYDYPQPTVVEPAGGRASLLAKLTGRMRSKAQSNPVQNHGQVAAFDPSPATSSARKPFLMGLLTGVVVMLILGQIFRAAGPSADYAQALPPTNMTVSDGPVSDDPEVLAFLDTVEGLN